MATHYLIKKEHAFLTQKLNLFYLQKNSRSLLFRKFPSESLNPSRSFLKAFVIFTSYPYSVLHFFYLYLFPGILEFWCLVTVTFKFTVLHNNIYRKKTWKLVNLNDIRKDHKEFLSQHRKTSNFFNNFFSNIIKNLEELEYYFRKSLYQRI